MLSRPGLLCKMRTLQERQLRAVKKTECKEGPTVVCGHRLLYPRVLIPTMGFRHWRRLGPFVRLGSLVRYGRGFEVRNSRGVFDGVIPSQSSRRGQPLLNGMFKTPRSLETPGSLTHG